MFNQLKNKITFAAIIPPVYAALNLSPQGDDFSTLTDVSAKSVISGAISLVILVTIIVFFFILVMGGLKWITGGGDEKKIASARAQITNGLIGLVIIFSVWAIIRLIGTIFGIDMFNLTIPSFLSSPSLGSAGTGDPMLE